ncbi:MAG TPA: acyltransferase [Chloroflexia bacterium]|nr:acyltransferase [Chloroflexia bacterium]
MATLLPRGLRTRIKPYAAGAISRFWVTWFRLRHGGRVQFGRNFETNGRLVIQSPGRVIFGDNIKAWAHAEKNVFITYTPESRIVVGGGTRLNGAGVMAYTTIRIGPRCILGSTVIFDSDFHPIDPARRHDPTAPVATRPITIGANVWLAGQTAVLKGTTIGENSVVAFRAVVSGAIPANVVVAGNPARIVKHFEAV